MNLRGGFLLEHSKRYIFSDKETKLANHALKLGFVSALATIAWYGIFNTISQKRAHLKQQENSQVSFQLMYGVELY